MNTNDEDTEHGGHGIGRARTNQAYTERTTSWPLFGTLMATGVVLIVVGPFTGPGAAAALVVCGVVTVVTALLFTSINLSVGAGRVHAGLGPFGHPSLDYPLAEIQRAEAVDIPLRRMRGWGLHHWPGGSVRLTVRSGPTLVLHRLDGPLVQISSRRPEAAAELINSSLVG